MSKNIDELLITLDLNNKSNLNYLGKSKQIGSDLEIFADKIMIDNKTTFYLCKSYTCNLPTNSIREIKSQVKKIPSGCCSSMSSRFNISNADKFFVSCFIEL